MDVRSFITWSLPSLLKQVRIYYWKDNRKINARRHTPHTHLRPLPVRMNIVFPAKLRPDYRRVFKGVLVVSPTDIEDVDSSTLGKMTSERNGGGLTLELS